MKLMVIIFQLYDEIVIKGNSIMCDVFGFYQPLIDWVEFYLKSKPTSIKLKFHVELYNTMSLKIFKDIISKLAEYSQFNVKNIHIKWFCSSNNIDSIENGKISQKEFPNATFQAIVIDS